MFCTDSFRFLVFQLGDGISRLLVELTGWGTFLCLVICIQIIVVHYYTLPFKYSLTFYLNIRSWAHILLGFKHKSPLRTEEVIMQLHHLWETCTVRCMSSGYNCRRDAYTTLLFINKNEEHHWTQCCDKAWIRLSKSQLR